MRKVLRFLFVIVLSVWAVDLSAQSQTVQFFAHRASRFEYDENTLPAFKACYEQGIRGFETDIRMSKDGQLVVNHDETFARLTPCTGAVESMAYTLTYTWTCSGCHMLCHRAVPVCPRCGREVA